MTEPVIIANRPFWPRVTTVFWALETAVGLLFAALGTAWLGGDENGAPVLMIVMGLMLALAGAVMTNVVWQAARLKGPAILASEHGFQDRRLSEQKIGWDHLQWKVVFNGRNWSLRFDIDDTLRSQFRVCWGNRVLALLNRALRYPAFGVMTLGTSMGTNDLSAVMSKFKKPQDQAAVLKT